MHSLWIKIASVTIVLLTLSEKRERKSGQSDVMWHEKLLQQYALSRNDTCWCAFWRFTYMLHSEINWKIPSSLFYPHELSLYFCQRKFNSQFLPVFTMNFFFDSLLGTFTVYHFSTLLFVVIECVTNFLANRSDFIHITSIRQFFQWKMFC